MTPATAITLAVSLLGLGVSLTVWMRMAAMWRDVEMVQRDSAETARSVASALVTQQADIEVLRGVVERLNEEVTG